MRSYIALFVTAYEKASAAKRVGPVIGSARSIELTDDQLLSEGDMALAQNAILTMYSGVRVSRPPKGDEHLL